MHAYIEYIFQYISTVISFLLTCVSLIIYNNLISNFNNLISTSFMSNPSQRSPVLPYFAFYFRKINITVFWRIFIIIQYAHEIKNSPSEHQTMLFFCISLELTGYTKLMWLSPVF